MSGKWRSRPLPKFMVGPNAINGRQRRFTAVTGKNVVHCPQPRFLTGSGAQSLRPRMDVRVACFAAARFTALKSSPTVNLLLFCEGPLLLKRLTISDQLLPSPSSFNRLSFCPRLYIVLY